MYREKRYIQQFLVNQLSQRSLIPTYSFPVHSLTLEVTKDYANNNSYGNQGDVALSRDASQGISEYAPGAEVVANGRLWKSTGLASYPKMFMPTEWYALCRSCHHVDIGIEKQDVAIECSHCGNTDKRTVGKYIKPLGFVTSYSDRHGSDPGTMRKRQRRADEAKLITKPSPEQFEETDVSLIEKAILRAQPIDEQQPGKLFIRRAILPHEILGTPVAKYSFTYGANWISPSTPCVRFNFAKSRYVKATSNGLTAVGIKF